MDRPPVNGPIAGGPELRPSGWSSTREGGAETHSPPRVAFFFARASALRATQVTGGTLRNGSDPSALSASARRGTCFASVGL